MFIAKGTETTREYVGSRCPFCFGLYVFHVELQVAREGGLNEQ